MSRVKRSPLGIVDKYPEFETSIKLKSVRGALMRIFSPRLINEHVTMETHQQRQSEVEW